MTGNTPAIPDYSIDLTNVTKVYSGRVHALRGIAMRVGRGEIFGLLGPNGAGKSTLVKCVMTVVRPTQAQGTILGQRLGHKPTLRRIGYLPENHRFPRYLTGRQTLEFFAAMHSVDRPTRKRRSAELLATVGMSDAADRKVSTYSKGMMQRVGLAQALVNDPELVLLDEPTDGVDPVGRRDIRTVLLTLRDEGKTVFINSHLLSELEMVCNRVAILLNGQVVRQGTIDELTMAQQRYEIEVAADNPAEAFASLTSLVPWSERAAPPPGGALVQHGKLAGGQWVEILLNVVRVGTADAAAIQPLVDGIRAAGLTIRRVQLVRPSLEELFMQSIGTTRGAA